MSSVQTQPSTWAKAIGEENIPGSFAHDAALSSSPREHRPMLCGLATSARSQNSRDFCLSHAAQASGTGDPSTHRRPMKHSGSHQWRLFRFLRLRLCRLHLSQANRHTEKTLSQIHSKNWREREASSLEVDSADSNGLLLLQDEASEALIPLAVALPGAKTCKKKKTYGSISSLSHLRFPAPIFPILFR